MPHGPWHQGANQVKHNIARASPFPPYRREGIDRHATLIMANPLTIGWVFLIQMYQSHQLRNFHNLTNCTLEFTLETLKSCETHVKSNKSLTSLFDNPNSWFRNDKRYSRSFICYGEGGYWLSEPRGAQKFVNYVWNSDQYHLTSVNQSSKR
jgi:hypothetical protein